MYPLNNKHNSWSRWMREFKRHYKNYREPIDTLVDRILVRILLNGPEAQTHFASIVPQDKLDKVSTFLENVKWRKEGIDSPAKLAMVEEAIKVSGDSNLIEALAASDVDMDYWNQLFEKGQGPLEKPDRESAANHYIHRTAGMLDRFYRLFGW